MLLERVNAAFASKGCQCHKMIVHGSKVNSVWASLSWCDCTIVLSRPPCEQSVQDFSTRYENFDNFFIICIEKLIDRPETKMTDVDPSLVGQHVQPLKNNYFKACTANACISIII